MLTPITIPDVGSGEAPLRLSAWFAEPGDAVEAGDRLLEVAISGMTCDVRAAGCGRLVRVEKQLDEVVIPGEIVGWVDVDATRAARPTSES
jgi:pyruvate/2-oxoglutarate dehydrogenase complex dihydrolipoamide acyltransferase (E2) component